MKFPHLILLCAAGLTPLFPAAAQEEAKPAPAAAEAPTANAVPAMNGTLLLILGESGEGATPQQRAAGARQLPPTLEEPEVTRLKAFAFGERPGEFIPPLWHALVNDLLDALLRQTRFRARGAGWLLEMAEKSTDPVLRDYALQKLPAAWRNAPAADQEKCLAALEKAAKDTSSSSAGTALLSLNRLAARDRTLLAKAAELALAAAKDTSAPEAARSTALQICASRKDVRAAPLARTILADSAASVALRISAAATLGRVGDASDRPALESAASDEALKPAAQAALDRLPQ